MAEPRTPIAQPFYLHSVVIGARKLNCSVGSSHVNRPTIGSAGAAASTIVAEANDVLEAFAKALQGE